MRFRFVVIVHPDENADISQKVVSRGILTVVDSSHDRDTPKVFFCETEGEAASTATTLAGKHPGKLISYQEISRAVSAQPGPVKAFKISSSGVLPG